MLQNRVKRGVMIVAFGLALFVFFAGRVTLTTQANEPTEPAVQQAQTPAAAPTEELMEQKYKNIQALKGLPAAQMRPLMNYISATLGMGCADCHVRTGDQWEFEKDDNNHKKIARRMISMTLEINKANFNGRPQVTCYTCHQGHDHPTSIPPLPRVQPQGGAAASGPAPKAEDILAKYFAAVGGKDALDKVKTRVIKGVSVAASGQSFPLEISFAAPDKYALSVNLPQGATTQKLNGVAGWLKNSREDRAMDSVDLARGRSLAASLDVTLFSSPALRLAYGGAEKINGRDVVVLRGAWPDKRRVRYFFDKESGLLVRRVVMTETVIGLDPEQTDYEDYRDVDGVKVPFAIKTSYLDTNYSSTRKFTEIKHNVAVDDAQFKLPAAK